MLTNQSNQGAHNLIHTVADAVGAVIAAGAVTSPWWRDQMHLASTFATEMAPILGVIWLAVQIVHKLSHWARRG